MKTKVLVTGGAGFIGSHLVDALLERGYHVRVLDDLSTGKMENINHAIGQIDFVQGDLTDTGALRLAVKDITGIFHLGAIPSVIRSIENPFATHHVNVTGTMKLLVAAKEAGVKRLIFSSSSSVYGDSLVLPKTEDMALSPLSPYAASKAVGEYYCNVFHRVMGFPTVCLRYFNVFGPRQDPASFYAAVIPNFIAAFLNDQQPTIYGDGEQSRDFTYVQDVALANIKAFEADDSVCGESINVAPGNSVSVNRLADMIGGLLGKPSNPTHVAPRAGEVRDSMAGNEKCKRFFNYVPNTPVDEGLQKTVAWYVDKANKG
ncbi:MAG: SDR family oxidoreductase [Chlamydiota bacterium]|nr:SDR family oxidoreductase [Chlamydiota bacterium]